MFFGCSFSVFNRGEMMATAREFMVVILGRKERKRADQKRVEERVAAGLCLNQKVLKPGTERIDCPNKATGSKGQCPACAAALDRFIASLPEDQRAQARHEAERNGWVLRSQEIREIKSTNLFRSLVS